MINWLYCLLFGHDFDRKDRGDLHIHGDDDPNIIIEKYVRYWCKRCQKYRKV